VSLPGGLASDVTIIEVLDVIWHVDEEATVVVTILTVDVAVNAHAHVTGDAHASSGLDEHASSGLGVPLSVSFGALILPYIFMDDWDNMFD
jgi:hypothetical protein